MRVSIVIPNWNGEKFLKNCIESIENQSYKDFDLIIVDNGSNDGSRVIFDTICESKNFKSHWIQLDDNYGFSRAVNEGIKFSNSEYVFLLNNDTEIHKECIKNLVDCFDNKDNAFSVSSKMMKYDNRNLIDDAGDMYTIFGWAYQRGHGKNINLFNEEKEIFASCAGAALYKRRIFEEIGFFDENHFAYLEDMDIGYRAKLNGYKNYFCPTAEVFHIGSGTTGGKYNAFKVKISARNSIYLIYKNMPLLQIFINLPFLILGILIKLVFFFLKSPNYGKVYFEGIVEGFLNCKLLEHFRFGGVNLFVYFSIQIELIKSTIRYFYEKIIRKI